MMNLVLNKNLILGLGWLRENRGTLLFAIFIPFMVFSIYFNLMALDITKKACLEPYVAICTLVLSVAWLTAYFRYRALDSMLDDIPSLIFLMLLLAFTMMLYYYSLLFYLMEIGVVDKPKYYWRNELFKSFKK